jgi:hypothetical protein
MCKGKFMKKLSCLLFFCTPVTFLLPAEQKVAAQEIQLTIHNNSEATPLNSIQTNATDAENNVRKNKLCTLKKRIATSALITLAGATEIGLIFYDPGNSEWARMLGYVGIVCSAGTFLQSASSLIFMPREVQNDQPCTYWNKLHKIIAAPVCMAASVVPFTSKWRFIPLALGGSWGACAGGVSTLNHIAQFDAIKHRR